MSKEVLRELVSAMTRLRREPADVDRIEQWAGRLEQHLAELELLAALALPETVEPAFAPVLDAGTRVDGGGDTHRTGATSSREAASPAAQATPGAPGGLPPSGPTLVEVVRALRRGEQSPEDLVNQALEAAEQLASLHIFIGLFPQRARQAAQRAARALRDAARNGGAGGLPLLFGVPLAVKDLMEIEGYAMTGGSRVLDSLPSKRDAAAVHRLRAQGAIVLGATNLHELAYGITSENPHFGPVRNPRHNGHIAGGSSGGSAAAVAAGIVPGAVGTDTGGSIRIPAAACGVAGLKPTYGRVSREGVFPLSWSLDHVGPVARAAADLAVMLAVMADSPAREELGLAHALVDPGEPGSGAGPGAALPAPLRAVVELANLDGGQHSGATREGLARAALDGLRFGRPDPDWEGPVEASIREGMARVYGRLAGAGAGVGVVDLPPPGHLRVAQFAIIQAEAASVHRERLRQRWDDFGHDVRIRLKIGEFLTAVDYLQGQRMRRQLSDKMGEVFRHVDVLVLPAMPVPAPPLGTRLVEVEGAVEPIQRALTRFTGPFNITGLPALTIPVGTTADGLPVGVQMVARWGREVDLIRAAVALEALLRA